MRQFNKFLDKVSEFLAHRKGLLILLGIGLVLINGVLQFGAAPDWLVESNLLLHLGVIIALVGVLLAWAL
jgi:uncharacterized membrane protein SirB2